MLLQVREKLLEQAPSVRTRVKLMDHPDHSLVNEIYGEIYSGGRELL